MMKATNFFAELKRRNVYKVAIAYAVVGWLLIQVATQVFPFFEIPNWGIRLIVLTIAIGFPIALIIAWAFELTPEGLKRTEVADREAVKSSQKKAWIYVVITAAALSLALFFVGRYTAPKVSGSSDLLSKSIAVLPFENLSEDKANEYFAEGIQEEILTRLSKIADLKVISRTSTQKYKTAPGNLREVAQQLGVANVLEGGVQKAADQVRVNVQLINANTDAHLWAETYDRNLTDIFQVESEIAKTIADKLQAKLTGSEERAISSRPTENPVAHQLCLKGRYFWNKRTGDDAKKAVEYFNQAIAADPKYALAYAGLADAYIIQPAFGAGFPRECYPKAMSAAKTALELDETLAEAHTSRAGVLLNYEFDFPQSLAEFQRAIQLNPNYATVHHWYAIGFLVSVGRFDEAIAEMNRALELDPLSLIINADLGSTYLLARRYDEAIEQFRRTIEMDPGFYYTHFHLGEALECKGNLNAAVAEYEKARQLNDDPRVLGRLGHAYAVAGRTDEALKIFNQLKEESKNRYVRDYDFALIELALGNQDQAIRWLEEGYEQHDGGPRTTFIKVDPFLDPLHGNPRFQALANKIVPANVK